MSEINFSIIIPTWNRTPLVEKLLKSLYEDRKNYTLGKTEVIIIDNSTGKEKAEIKSSVDKYDAIYIEGPESVRRKRNMGIDAAKYEYILFIDSDVVVKSGLIDTHAHTFLDNQENKKLAGSFGLTEFVGEKSFWWKILELTTFIDSFSFAKQYPYVSWTIGNNVAFKKSVLLEIGKFEENLPYKLGGDDLDMTYRVTKAGYLIKTAPDAVTFHSRETWNNWKAISDRSRRWGSMEYYVMKRHPELVHRRLPMTGDIVLMMLFIFSIISVLKMSFVPILFWGIWCVILFFMMYGLDVKRNGWKNPFLWSVAMMLQGKYRFHRLIMSIKKKDFSLAFKGQYFGIYHIRGDFRSNAEKTWLHQLSIMLIIIVMAIVSIITK